MLENRFQSRDLPEDVEGLPTNQFCSALGLWCDGSMTRQQVIRSFDLTEVESVQLDRIKTVHDSKSTTMQRIAYLTRVKNVLMLLEQSSAMCIVRIKAFDI